MPQNHTARPLPQHRHHGPHRCRQDDDDRAHPLLHRQVLQDRRGARRHRDDGLDGAGAGARHHHHLGRDDLLLARPPHQHHRHARPRRLHDRGRALACACSTARSRCSTASPASSRSRRRCGARPTSTACRASASSTRWTASAPTSSAASTMIADRLGAKPAGHPAADRRRERLSSASSISSRMKAHHLEGRDARRRVHRQPTFRPTCKAQADGVPPQAGRDGGRAGRRRASRPISTARSRTRRR